MNIHTGNPKFRVYGLPTAPTRFEREGNPLYPLPKDYHELDSEGQRIARVNAMCLRETAEDRVIAWTCLRDWHLLKMPPGAWYKEYHPDAPLHYGLIHDLHAYPRTVQAFPRSFGKTVKINEFLALNMLTYPYFRASLIKSNIKFANAAVLMLKKLFTFDSIVHDFGRLEPRKGHGKWSDDYLVLANGAELMASSVMSPQLGPHPHCWILDDCEFDPKMRVSPTLLTENLMSLMQEQLIPQLDHQCSGHFIGTLNTVRMLIYQYARTPVAEAPKLAYWHRVIYGAKNEYGQLTWADKFDESRLATLRDELGEAGFNAAMMNQPSTDQARLLELHPKFSNYAIEDSDEYLRTSPLQSSATLVSWRPDPAKPKDGPIIVDRRPLKDVLERSSRMILVDPCKNPDSPVGDFACIMAIAREKSDIYTDDLWVMDLLLERLNRNQIIQKAWDMAVKWRVRVIGVEDYGEFQHNLYERMDAEFREKAEDLGWSPRVHAIKYKGDSRKDKGTRIADALIWRFEQNRVKLPHHLRSDKTWGQLFYQIENFTQDLKLLPHDDAIDSLAMFHYVIKLPGSYSAGAAPEPLDVEGMLKSGQRYYPGTQIPLLALIPPERMTRELLNLDRDIQARNRRPNRFRTAGSIRASRRGLH